MTKLTRQQRLGLLLTGILMALVALLFAIIRPQPAVEARSQVELETEQPVKAPEKTKSKTKKPKPQPAPRPEPRKHLDDEF